MPRPIQLVPPILKTLEEFRAFYDAIPDEEWHTKTYLKSLFDSRGGADPTCRCALGWLMPVKLLENGVYVEARNFDENEDNIDRLQNMLGRAISSINDGRNPAYQQATPKARILAAIDDAIARDQSAFCPGGYALIEGVCTKHQDKCL